MRKIEITMGRTANSVQFPVGCSICQTVDFQNVVKIVFNA